jgi:hypothetical protein
MGNIISKKELDLVIESTLKENGLLKESKTTTKPKNLVKKKVVKENNEETKVKNLINEDLKRFNAIVNHKLK